MRRRWPWLLITMMVVLSIACGKGALGWERLSGLPMAHQNMALPPLVSHPLPSSLAALPPEGDDYFDEVPPLEVGYLLWTTFPVKVAIEPPERDANDAWRQAAQQAVAEWSAYLPLQIVAAPEPADIRIQSQRPSDQNNRRVRAAETSFELFVDSQGVLRHRMRIVVRPTQAPRYVLAALRHELGHALGIWGHSPLPTDALYFAQVADPPPISRRDVNTLRRIYEQPTRLGQPIPEVAARG